MIQKAEFFYPEYISRLSDPDFQFSMNYCVKINEDELTSLTDNAILTRLGQIDQRITNDSNIIQQHNVFDFIFGLIRQFEKNLAFRSMRILETLMRQVNDWIHLIIQVSSSIQQQDPLNIRINLKMILFLGFYMFKATMVSSKQKTDLQIMNQMMKNKKRKKGDQFVNNDLSRLALKAQWSIIVTLADSLLNINFKNIWRDKVPQKNFLLFYDKLAIDLITSGLINDQTPRIKAQFILNELHSIEPTYSQRFAQEFLRQSLVSNEITRRSIVFFQKAKNQRTINNIQTIILQGIKISKNQKNGSFQNQQVKNLSTFYSEIATKHYQIFLDYLPYFFPIFECQHYLLRNSIVNVIHQICVNVFNTNSEQHKSNKRKFVMFLLKRTNDKSPFVRSHIFSVLQAMLHDKQLDIHLVLELLKVIKERIRDINSHVRRKTMGILTQSIRFFIIFFRHYSKHLNIQQVKQEIQKVKSNVSQLQQIESNLKLRLQQQNQTRLSEELKQHQALLSQNKKLSTRYQIQLEVLQLIQYILPTLNELIFNISTHQIKQVASLIILLTKQHIQNIDTVLPWFWKNIFNPDITISTQIYNSFKQVYFREFSNRSINLINIFTNSDSYTVMCFQEMIRIMIQKSKENDGCLGDIVIGQIWNHFKSLLMNTQDNKSQQLQKTATIRLLETIFEYQTSKLDISIIYFALSYFEKFRYSSKEVSDCQSFLFLLKLIKRQIYHFTKDMKLLIMKQCVLFFRKPHSYPIQIWSQITDVFSEIIIRVCDHPEIFFQQIILEFIETKLQIFKKYKQGKGSKKSVWNISIKYGYLMGKFIKSLATRCDNMAEQSRRIIFEGCNNIRRDGNKLIEQFTDQNEKQCCMCWINTNIMRFQHNGEDLLHKFEHCKNNLIKDKWLQKTMKRTNQYIQKLLSHSKQLDQGGFFSDFNIENLGICMASNREYASENAHKLISIMNQGQSCNQKVHSICTFADVILLNSSGISQFTQQLFTVVLDDDEKVQMAALRIIRYLITQDIILFDNQMSYFAILFQNSSQKIKKYCKSILISQQKRNQTFIYIRLPQIIYDLSNEQKTIGKRRITEQSFTYYARELLPQLQKQRSRTSIIQEAVDSIMGLLREQNISILFIRNVCLSLSLFYHTDKSLTTIIKYYSEVEKKIKDPICKKYFQELLGRLRRSKKPQLKLLLDEFQAKYINYSTQIFINRHPTLIQKNNKKRKPRKKGQKNKTKDEIDEENEFSSELTTSIIANKNKRGKATQKSDIKPKRNNQRKQHQESDEDWNGQ